MIKTSAILIKSSLLALCSVLETWAGVHIDMNRATLPVLADERLNHVGYIRITPDSTDTPKRLTGISWSLAGTSCLESIEEIALYACNDSGKIDQSRLAAVTRVISESGQFKLNIPLPQGASCWAFAVNTKPTLPLGARVNLNCTRVSLDGQQQTIEPRFREGLRTGIALRKHRQDGVHTSRIPGLVVTKRGTLLAIYDARWESGRDLQGDIDIALNRSEDGGQSWQPMQIVLDQGTWEGFLSDSTELATPVSSSMKKAAPFLWQDCGCTGFWMGQPVSGLRD